MGSYSLKLKMELYFRTMPFFMGCWKDHFEVFKAKIGGRTAELEQ